MTDIPKKCRSLVLPIILVQIQATYSSYLYQRNFFHHNNDESTDDYRYKDSMLREFYYSPQSLRTDDKRIFFRKAKSSNPPRMLNIDLSRLRKDKDLPTAHGNMRHKSPVGLLGIDISALSRNPDPTLPLAVVHPQNILNGKTIMGYDFDPKYDRLPIIKSKPIQTYLSLPKPATKVLPVMHIPLKVMTTYHSILTNKKEDIDFNFGSGMSDDIESEQKYTANFILHLLYQLSSSYGKTV